MTTTTNSNSFGFDLANVPEGDRARVAAMIPDPAIEGAYLTRTMNGVPDLEAMAGHMIERENILIEGPASCGKTLAPRAFASRHGLPFATINVNGNLDGSRLWVDLVPTGDPDRPLVKVETNPMLVIRHGGILKIDEINMAHERVTAMFHELTDDNRQITVQNHGGESVKVAYPSLIVGTMNPPGGASYRGTREMNGALNDRFVRWAWGYDRGIESQLVESPTLLDLAESIRGLPEVTTPLGTRSLMSFERHVARFGMAYALARFIDRFRESERPGVRRALEMSAPSISADLGVDPDHETAPDATALNIAEDQRQELLMVGRF
jgi:MoxR-like ATPase